MASANNVRNDAGLRDLRDKESVGIIVGVI
jgi:hypothetical protein